MRFIVRVAVLVVVLRLLALNMVFAEDYLTEAVQALQHAPVYVATGTEGTDKDTAGKLQGMLKNEDNIVLVMLPAAAEKDLGTDITTIASQLSERLGNKRIIGLAIGRKVVGYAPTLPAGVASDQMKRAENVSNDSVTAMVTFIQNIHSWQKENPQPTPSPLESVEKGGLSWFGWLVLVIIAAALISGTLALVNSNMTSNNTERARSQVPNQIRGLLEKIEEKYNLVNDLDIRDKLSKICEDTDNYFARYSKDKQKDANFLKARLNDVVNVLVKYIDIQQYPRYYRDPQTQLAKGKNAISGFSQYILESIQRGRDVDLSGYEVDTKILQAQRYR